MAKKRLTKIILIWLILMVASALLGKATIASDNGQSAADFLSIGVGARSAALGGAFTAVTNDATAAYWNPGRLSSLTSAQVAFSHFSWYQDLNYEYLSVAVPVHDKITLAASSSYLSYGTIEGYDQYDNPTGELQSTYDMMLAISAGYKISDRFSVGLTGKYIMQSLAGTDAGAVAADLGASYIGNNFVVGLTAANLGQKMKFENESYNLPATIRGGLAVYPFGNMLMASLEYENQFEGASMIKNGYELCFEDKYFVRAGLAYYPGEDERQFGQSTSFGVGAIFGPALFDYTFTPEEKFTSENIHRFSVILHF